METNFGVPNWSLSNLTDDTQLVLTTLLPPTPLLVKYGDADPVNYLPGGPAAIDLVREVYVAYGSELPPTVSIEPGAHEFFPVPIVEFFDQHLRR